jgi:hypothetical protein
MTRHAQRNGPPPEEAATPVAGYRSVFAVREFRAIFAAHVLSVLGGVFAEVALAVRVMANSIRRSNCSR